MKKILITLIVLAVIGASYGYYMYNKPLESLENKEADVTISADQLIADYEADEKTANEKYLGKVVVVSGKIAEITNEEGKKKVNLETSNPISAVICEMEENKKTENLKAGDMIKVKGMCSGYLSDVILVQSVLVK
jgi:tRNA_anti-like